MADRFPLIVDPLSQQIKELPAGDNLDLSSSNLVNVVDLTATGSVTIGGDLTVEGALTTLSTNDLVVEDKNIVIADGAADATAADGAGITIDGANATITYVASSDRLVFNKDIEAATLVGQVTDISNHTTADLSETATERYFTPTREEALLDEAIAFAVAL
jgi:hypothetical protein